MYDMYTYYIYAMYILHIYVYMPFDKYMMINMMINMPFDRIQKYLCKTVIIGSL